MSEANATQATDTTRIARKNPVIMIAALVATLVASGVLIAHGFDVAAEKRAEYWTSQESNALRIKNIIRAQRQDGITALGLKTPSELKAFNKIWMEEDALFGGQYFTDRRSQSMVHDSLMAILDIEEVKAEYAEYVADERLSVNELNELADHALSISEQRFSKTRAERLMDAKKDYLSDLAS